MTPCRSSTLKLGQYSSDSAESSSFQLSIYVSSLRFRFVWHKIVGKENVTGFYSILLGMEHFKTEIFTDVTILLHLQCNLFFYRKKSLPKETYNGSIPASYSSDFSELRIIRNPRLAPLFVPASLAFARAGDSRGSGIERG